MRAIHVTSFLVLVTMVACSVNDQMDNRRKNVTKSIVGQALTCQSLDGYKIVDVYKDYLFLREDRDTSRLVVYQIAGDSLKFFKGLIDRGRGPYEFYYPEYSLCDDSLFVSNSDPTGIKAIYGISLDTMSEIDNPRRWKEYRFPEQEYIITGMSFARIDKGVFVISGGKANTKQVLSLADFNKQECVPLSFWPKDSTEGPLDSKQMVYMQSEIFSQGRKILYANSYARFMFIASVEGAGFVENTLLYSSLPKYTIKPDGNIRYSDDGEYGIRPYSTHEYVFAKVGRTIQEAKASDTYKGYPKQFFDEVEVYDWDGNFIDNFQTDRPFSSYAVSSDNQFLYAMTIDLDSQEPIVLKYKLQL